MEAQQHTSLTTDEYDTNKPYVLNLGDYSAAAGREETFLHKNSQEFYQKVTTM